ncbi:MAG: hypothetical protein HC942_11010 [Microcoleus sp. SU_5_6]|nr:hypothetical protein [Microcoleus sp. SU_5_6]
MTVIFLPSSFFLLPSAFCLLPVLFYTNFCDFHRRGDLENIDRSPLNRSFGRSQARFGARDRPCQLKIE